MGFLDLLFVASMPVLKVLLVTALGSFLALDHIDILGENARKHINGVAFFVFNPSLVGSNLAKTITFESIVLLWFMPFNILITFIIGSALGWLLIKITRAPQHLKGLILGSCAAGNLGNLPLIIIPAVCKEKGSPFGAPDVCHTYGMAYASLSMAVGAVYLWSYVYNIVRISSSKIATEVNIDDSTINMKHNGETSKLLDGSCTETLLPSKDCFICLGNKYQVIPSCITPEEEMNAYIQAHMPACSLNAFVFPFLNKSMFSLNCDLTILFVCQAPISAKIKQHFRRILRNVNLKALFAPSTIGAIVGFIIGVFPLTRKLIIGSSAPLHVVQDSASLLGDAAIPTVTLIVGANLLKGLKGSGIQPSLIVGVVAVRYIFLPLSGILVVKGAIHMGLVQSDPLYQFVLLLQYALPPAMNIGTITQLFGAGESECSVIMLWTYALASVALTLWSTFFMWLIA